jgi:hypothetical protein
MVEEIELAENPRARAVLRGILEPGEVWDKLPVKKVSSLEVRNRRWKSLPTPKFSHIGDSYGSGGGKTEAISFGLKVIGHDLDIPKVFDEETDHIVDPKALQTEMVLTGLSYLLNSQLFNGDESLTTNGPGFDGLKRISADMLARQQLDASAFAPAQPATFLDLRSGGADSATRQAFLDLLAKAHRRLERDAKSSSGPTTSFPSALMVMNENLYDLVEAMIRREGLLRVTTDQFDRTINQWRNMPFVDAGFADMDGTNLVIANDHDVPGAAVPTTSIYFLLLDPDKHIGVLQTRGLDVRKIGELQTGPVIRYRIDWTLGVVVWGKRSLVRVRNLRVA